MAHGDVKPGNVMVTEDGGKLSDLGGLEYMGDDVLPTTVDPQKLIDTIAWLNQHLGFTPPEYVHVGLLRNADKSKISKRKNPVSLNFYRRAGYLPEAMLNYLGRSAKYE